MNRRGFLSSMLAAGAAAMFLPGAGRRWIKPAALIIPDTTIVCEPAGVAFFDLRYEYELSFLGNVFGKMPAVGAVIKINGAPGRVKSYQVVESHAGGSRTSMIAEVFPTQETFLFPKDFTFQGEAVIEARAECTSDFRYHPPYPF